MYIASRVDTSGLKDAPMHPRTINGGIKLNDGDDSICPAWDLLIWQVVPQTTSRSVQAARRVLMIDRGRALGAIYVEHA